MSQAAPRCFNRPPFPLGRLRKGMGEDGEIHATWIPNDWFKDRCATHDGRGIGQNGENYAEANGWLPWCARCRWNPNK